MDIENIYIKKYYSGRGFFHEEGLFHQKEMPYLSVAQAVTGSYEFCIDDSATVFTKPKGVFIAPSGVMQNITHHLDQASKQMISQWVLLDMSVNEKYLPEDIYSFPLLLPEKYNEEVYHLISSSINAQMVSALPLLYRLVEILFSVGKKKIIPEEFSPMKQFLEQNYAQKINMNDFAASFNMSVPTMFRRFQSCTGTSPARYLSNIRLRHACAMLENSDLSIDEIAEETGIGDRFYFSKLFKERYNVTPVTYRKFFSHAKK